jgi:hypothetical protein
MCSYKKNSKMSVMNLDATALMWGVLFGSIGSGFMLYGKKQKKPVPLVCGLLLIVYPYFVTNNLLIVAIGVGLIAVPYFYRP